MMRAKTKKKELAYFIDIQKSKDQEILDLRKRTKIINWTTILIALIIGGWLFYGLILKANVIYFYPLSVLGNWQNVNKATGEPSLDFDAELKYFNENNSAVFEGGGLKQIFLGNFQNPSLTDTDGKEIIGAKLKMNFRIADKNEWIRLQQENKEVNLIEATPTSIIVLPEEITPSVDNDSSNSENLLEETILPSDSESTEITNPTQIQKQVPIPLKTNPLIEEAPPTINQPIPESPFEDESTSTPVSLLKIFLKKVFAQESPTESSNEVLTPTPTDEFLPIQELISPTPDVTATPTNSPPENLETLSDTPLEITAETLNPETTTETIDTEDFNVETTTPLMTAESFSEVSTTSSPNASFAPLTAPLFIIKYTLDGENWQVLAAIEDKTNYPNEFSLPINDWNEINNLQIAIESTLNTNLEDNLIAFLDGTQLDVEYNLIEEDDESTTPAAAIKPFEFPKEIQAMLDILKTKVKPQISLEDINAKTNSKNSCLLKPFNLEIYEGEIKEVVLSLKRNQKALIEKIFVGNLPMGIEMFFEKNNDYFIQPQNNENEFNIKIISLPNSQKGNFSVPIIYQSGDSTAICQINIINF